MCSNAESRVQLAAVEAIPAFLSQYYLTESGLPALTERDSLCREYTAMLRGHEQQRKGFALALGAMPVRYASPICLRHATGYPFFTVQFSVLASDGSKQCNITFVLENMLVLKSNSVSNSNLPL